MKLTIVEFADISGTGFDRQPDPAHPVDREFWAGAQKLLARDVVQPPELIKATRGHPVWGLRRAPVGGQPMWCFWIQGRGGEFGPAGTCRFGFIDTDEHPVFVWLAGVEQVARQPQEIVQPKPGEDTEAIYQVLGSIGIGSKRIAIPATPAQAARVIRGVLGVLLPMEIEDRVWATCLLQPLDDQKVVAAPPPESIAAAQYVRRIDRTLASTMGGMDLVQARLESILRVPDPIEGVKRLAGYAARGDLIHQRLKSRPDDFAGLLTCVSNELRELSALEVPDLLEHEEGRDRLRSAREKVDEWVEMDKEGALAKLRRLPLEPVVVWLFEELVKHQRSAETEIIGWPTQDREGQGDPRWPARLGGLLKQCFPRPTPLVEFLKDLVRGGILSRADLVRGREVLLAANLKPKSARDLFPLTAELIATSLRSGGALTTEMHDEIAAYRDDDPFGTKLKLLSDAVFKTGERGLVPMRPGDAVRYFAAADLKNQPPTEENGRLAFQMASCLAKAALSPSGPPGPWLIPFLKGLGGVDTRKQGPRQNAALGALSVLDEWEFRLAQLPDRDSLNKVVNNLGISQALTSKQLALLQPQTASKSARHEPTTVVYSAGRHPGKHAQREGAMPRESLQRPVFQAPPDEARTVRASDRKPSDGGRGPKATVARLRQTVIVIAATAVAAILLLVTIMANVPNDKQTPPVNASRTKSPSTAASTPPISAGTGTISVTSPLRNVISAVMLQVDKQKTTGAIHITKVIVSGNLAPEQRDNLTAVLDQLLRKPGFEDAAGEVRGMDLAPVGEAGSVTVEITFDRR